MNIQGFSPLISAPQQAQAASTSGTSGSGDSGSSTNGLSANNLQATFLNLLVTELQNQDPTQPVDPTQMVGQMVSLNQLDQLIAINETLSSIAGTATTTPTTNSAQSTHAPIAANVSHQANGTTGAQPNALAQIPATAFQGMPATGATPYSGTLMNLYGNIGASVPTSNQFIAAGGR